MDFFFFWEGGRGVGGGGREHNCLCEKALPKPLALLALSCLKGYQLCYVAHMGLKYTLSRNTV